MYFQISAFKQSKGLNIFEQSNCKKGRAGLGTNLRSNHSRSWGVCTNLNFTRHLAPSTRVAPHKCTAVITAGAMNAIALPNAAAEAAGHDHAAVQKRHAETPAKLWRSLALQTWETPQGTATGGAVRAAVADACGPCPRTLGCVGRHWDNLLLDSHDSYLLTL